jgi:DNA-binding NarL/FixJ family response regulator
MQTVFEDDDRVFESICAGASGYILKIHLNSRLIDAIKELQYGGSPLSPAIARKVMNKLQQIPQYILPEQVPDYNLTPRKRRCWLA